MVSKGFKEASLILNIYTILPENILLQVFYLFDVKSYNSFEDASVVIDASVIVSYLVFGRYLRQCVRWRPADV